MVDALCRCAACKSLCIEANGMRMLAPLDRGPPLDLRASPFLAAPLSTHPCAVRVQNAARRCDVPETQTKNTVVPSLCARINTFIISFLCRQLESPLRIMARYLRFKSRWAARV